MRCRLLCAMLLTTGAIAAKDPEPPPVLRGMPIHEVTIFKDGSSWIEHRGPVKVDEDGRAVVEGLPAPYLGTFWAASLTNGAKLVSAVASERDSTTKMPATQVRELIRANPGKRLHWTESAMGSEEKSTEYSGVILPQEEEQAYTLVDLNGGNTRVLNPDAVQRVWFDEPPQTEYDKKSTATSLTLRFDKGAANEVSVSYVQEGLRWIPSYRVEMGEDGKARVKLQATIVNDLADLEDAEANLVIGVPTFAFKGMTDPFALQKVLADVAGANSYYRGARVDGTQMQMLSNSLMTQSAFGGDAYATGEHAAPGPAPELSGGEKQEDLFVFTVDHLTLKRGERMIVPVGEYEARCETIFKLSIPFGPPPEILAEIQRNGRADELQRELAKPKAKSYLRLCNDSTVPFTTAPAMIIKGDRLIAQNLMRYTPPKGTVDLEMTAATDIGYKKKDRETGRTPNATTINGTSLSRVDVEGTIELTNLRGQPLKLEVRREVFGHPTEASDGGEVVQLTGEWDGESEGVTRPPWWGYYSWPWWWATANPPGSITWNIELKDGEEKTLTYHWNYYWQP